MSDDILKHYQQENERLRAEVESVRRENAKHRTDRNGKLKEAEAQLAAANADLEKLRKDNASLAKKVENLPTELNAEVDRLKGELRTRDHKAKFSDLAKELKIRPEALDDAFNFAWKAESDEVDENAMKAAISDLLEKKPYLRAEDQAPRRPVQLPGGGQGGKVSDAPGHFTATAEQMKDYNFVRQNRDKIIQATKARTFHRQPSTLDLAIQNLER